MAWHESVHLLQELITDPSSHVATAVAGWAYPITAESIVLRDTYDLHAAIHSGRKSPPSYPRPWDEKPQRFGSTTHPPAEVKRILADLRAGKYEEANSGH